MKKHIVHVGVGDTCPPKEAMAYVAKIAAAFEEKNFFPPDSVVFLPHRGDSTYVEDVEVGF